MAKNDFKKQDGELTVEEARKLRAANHAPAEKPLSNDEKREAFRVFWAQAKSTYRQAKELEQVLWLHLKAINKDHPKDFEAGLENFGLKKKI